MTAAALKLNRDRLTEAFELGVQQATQDLCEMMETSDGFRIEMVEVSLMNQEHINQLIASGIEDAYGIKVTSDSGENFGEAGVFYKKGEARNMIVAVLGEEAGSDEVNDVLCEVSNLLTNACLTQISPVFSLKLLGGVPDKMALDHFRNISGDMLSLKAKFSHAKNSASGEINMLLPAKILEHTT